MADENTPARRRPGSRPVLAVLGAAALAVGAAAGFGERGAADPDPASAATERRAGGTAPALDVGTAERLAAAASSRARLLSVRAARRGIAGARHRGGSPVALLTANTALRASPGGHVLARLTPETEFGSARVQAVLGMRRGWVEVLAAELPNGGTGWLHAADVRVGRVGVSLHVDLSSRTLEVRRRGRVLRRVLVAVGGPATPTPVGRFAVTDKLRIGDEGSIYGCCAIAFTGHQPNVPQEWSGGDRLAVHATPLTATIGHAASLGCLRAADADMRWLMHRLPLGTPVTIKG